MLSNPRAIRVRRNTGNKHTPGTQLNEEQHIEGLQEDRFDREEVTRQHLVLVMVEESAPGTSASLWRRGNAMTLQHVADRRLRDMKTEFEQFAVDLAASPARVLFGQTDGQLFQFNVNCWSATGIVVRVEGPFAAHKFAVPFEHRIRFEEVDDIR